MIPYEDRLKIKFNSGYGAILCSGCSKILKVGKEFTEEELLYFTGEIKHLPPQFCEECTKNQV